jgi:tetratricopeptide (TPR) repeat protein
MPNKDYMMRYFEQLGVVLAALLGFRAKGNYEEALSVIRTTLDELPDFYYDLSGLGKKELLARVTQGETVSDERTEMIGTLLFQEAEFLYLSGDTGKALDRYGKAMDLLSHIDRTTGTWSMDRREMINKCKKITGTS